MDKYNTNYINVIIYNNVVSYDVTEENEILFNFEKTTEAIQTDRHADWLPLWRFIINKSRDWLRVRYERHFFCVDLPASFEIP